eukprot:Hpha_TRINITY_DN16685_c4_g2::TRINITY_DN16685_c4_g2_i1::g.178979::m.178979
MGFTVLFALGTLAANECDFWGDIACGKDQTCTDSNSTGYGKDYECRCSNGVSAVGGPALCEIDECEPMQAYGGASRNYRTACGPDQTCSDPDTSANSRGDFICTCKGGGAWQSGTWARCSVDECIAPTGTSGPCGPDQACSDAANKTARSGSQSSVTLGWGDYTCSCPGGGASNVGGPAVCTAGGTECDANPCGQDQACTDPSPTVGDYICACTAPYIGSAKGQAAECHIDDCWTGSVSKCGTGQICQDESTSQAHSNKHLHDFWCRCLSPMFGEGQGQAAPCMLDDCDWPSMDCGTQGCNDKNRHSSKFGVYHCYCNNQVDAINRQANCTISEECPADQVQKCKDKGEACMDNDTRGDAIGVFRCAPVAATPSPEEDDSSMPWYVVAVIALAVLCCILFCAALVRWHRRRQIREKFRAGQLPPSSPGGEKSTSEMNAPYKQVDKSPKGRYQGQQFLSVPGQQVPRQQRSLLTAPEAGQVAVAQAGLVAGAVAAQKARARKARSPGQGMPSSGAQPGIVITCKPTDERAPDSGRGPPSRTQRQPGYPTSPTRGPDSPRRASNFEALGSVGSAGSSQRPLYKL